MNVPTGRTIMIPVDRNEDCHLAIGRPYALEPIAFLAVVSDTSFQ